MEPASPKFGTAGQRHYAEIATCRARSPGTSNLGQCPRLASSAIIFPGFQPEQGRPSDIHHTADLLHRGAVCFE